MGRPDRPGGSCRLGVAVDGEHVAAALVDERSVLAVTTQRLATQPAPDAALSAVLAPLLAQPAAGGRTAADIDRVAFAVGQVDGLAVFPHADSAQWQPWVGEFGPVAVVRLGAATTAVPPLALWPPDFRARVALAEACVAGGARLDGTELEPLDETRLVDFARAVAGRVAAVAVTGVFATLTPDHELAAAEILEKELGGTVPILLSHENGGLGLLARENATVLQAALTGPAERGGARLQTMLVTHGLAHAEMFFARNDGTIMSVDYAATHPLALYGGVAAATVRGVARLAGEKDALVALARPDGTAPAICAVIAGLPQLSPGNTTIAGVPTSLRVVSRVPVRPSGEAVIVDSLALSEAIDRAKTSPGDLPLLLGGPGAEALAATLPPRLPGTVGVRCPAWASAAAAVGVATAPVGGEAMRIHTVSGGDAGEIREAVGEAARAAAVRAGADPRRAAVAAIEERPLTYLTDPAVVLRARAEGPPRPGVALLAEPDPAGDQTDPSGRTGWDLSRC